MKMDWKPLGYWPSYQDGKLQWVPQEEKND